MKQEVIGFLNYLNTKHASLKFRFKSSKEKGKNGHPQTTPHKGEGGAGASTRFH